LYYFVSKEFIIRYPVRNGFFYLQVKNDRQNDPDDGLNEKNDRQNDPDDGLNEKNDRQNDPDDGLNEKNDRQNNPDDGLNEKNDRQNDPDDGLNEKNDRQNDPDDGLNEKNDRQNNPDDGLNEKNDRQNNPDDGLNEKNEVTCMGVWQLLKFVILLVRGQLNLNYQARVKMMVVILYPQHCLLTRQNRNISEKYISLFLRSHANPWFNDQHFFSTKNFSMDLPA
jgi:hypothetical protein